MVTLTSLDYYRRILDSLEPGTLERYDREEGGYQGRGCYEHEQGGGALTFSALCRNDQAAILHAIDTNLPTRTKRVNPYAGNSYGLKHTVERFTGFYVSNLQAKVAMRVLGYQRGGSNELNPCYNISKRERRAFDELARDMADRRSAALKRIDRQRDAQKCARYFYRMTKTA